MLHSANTIFKKRIVVKKAAKPNNIRIEKKLSNVNCRGA